MAEMTDKQVSLSDLVYSLGDKPPLGNTLLSAVAHLLVIFIPMVTSALIVGGVLGLPAEVTVYLVSTVTMASGVGACL